MDDHRTPRELMTELDRRLPPETQVGLVDFKEQLLLFSHRPLTHFSYLEPIQEQERRAWLWMNQDRRRVLLLPDHLNLTCFDLSRQQVLGTAHRRDWVLLDAGTLRAGCEAPRRLRSYTWAPRRTDILE